MAGSGASVCVGTTSTTLGATAPTVGVGAWTTTSGPNTPTFGSASSASSTLSNLIPGVYVLKWSVSNGNCPVDTSDVQINVERPANAGANQNICASSSTEVNGNLPVLGSGTWSYISGPAGSSISAPISPATNISGLVQGTYVFQWSTPMAGCPDNTSNVTITNNPLPVVSAGSDATICIGSSATLTATSGLTAYAWAPATGLSCTTCASTTASPLATTVYTVTGTNSNGCSNTSTVTVNVNPLPTVSAGSAVSICIGNSTTLTATGGLTAYAWSPASGLSCTTCGSTSANPVTTTIYTVTATNSNGCVNAANVTVTVNPLPTVSAGAPSAVCIGNSTVLTATSGLASYSWAPAAGLGCSTCLSTSASPATTTGYTVTGTNANGCVDTARVTITVNPLPTVSAGSAASICAGSPTTLSATSGLTAYSWSPSTGLACRTCASTSADPAASTVYTVTGTNANGCANKASVAVTVNPLPAISAGSPVSICIGNSTTLNATGALSYAWSPSTGLSCTSCAGTTATPVATTIYTVTGTNSNGCVNNATVAVTVNTLPTISAGPAVSICSGSAASLTATSGLSAYSWAPAAGLSCSTCAGTSASPASATVFTVTGTDHNGCVNNASVSVSVNPLPTISAGSPVAVCNGSATTLTATTGLANYSWSPSAGLSCNTCASTSASPAATTTYEVSASDAHCSNTASVTVTVNQMPDVAQIDGLSQVCIGATINLSDATTGGTWSAANGNATISGGSVTGVTAGTENIQYTVTISGCTTTRNFPVQVAACNCCH